MASFPTSYIRTEGSTVTRAADITQISGNDFGTFNLLQYSEEFNRTWTSQDVTIKPNVTTAPDGTQTAQHVIPDVGKSLDAGNVGAYIRQDITKAASATTYTYSVYGKSGTYNGLRIFVRDSATSANNAYGHFVLTGNGSTDTVAANGTFSGASANIESVGNGWYRCSLVYTTSTETGNRTFIVASNSPSVTSDGTNGIYVWGAQLEESSTATPYVKSDVTWSSRGSNATYYDKDGVLRKSSYNLLLRSEEFDNSYWEKLNSGTGSAPVLTPGFDAPDGTATAYRLQADAGSTTGSGNYSLLQKGVSASAENYTSSVWLKSNTGSNQNVYFRVSSVNSVVVTTEWQRFEISENISNPLHTVGARGDTGSDASIDILVWGAQLEKGTYAGDYAKTEGSPASTARTNAYLPDGSGNFVSAGELLLEESRNNEIKYSEDFTQVDISKWQTYQIAAFGSGSVANAITAPDGTLSAEKIAALSGTSQPRYFQNTTGSGAWTMSVYAKAAEADCIFVAIYTGSTYKHLYYDLTNESVVSVTASSHSVVNVGNGWFRVSVTDTTTNPFGNISFGLSNAALANTGAYFVSDGTDGIYVWGAQLEAGSYPSSYIPTYGSTATRAADVSTSSSNTFGNSFYNQTEGTVFNSFVSLDPPILGFSSVFNDGTNSNRLGLQTTDTRFGRAVVSVGGVDQSLVGTGGVVAGDTNKIALHYALNDFAISKNGEAVSTDVSGSIPTVNKLDIGQAANTAYLNNSISRLTVWPTRLSNESLQAITS